MICRSSWGTSCSSRRVISRLLPNTIRVEEESDLSDRMKKVSIINNCGFGKAVALILILMFAATVLASVFLYSENLYLKKQILALEDKLATSKRANLVTALGITEISYTPSPAAISAHPSSAYVGNFSNVWITGHVLNSGASMAYNAGLKVLASDCTGEILMNITVPLISGSYSTDENETLMPYYIQLSPLAFGNVLSQQDLEVRIAIYHESTFSNSTKYEMTPVWTNSP